LKRFPYFSAPIASNLKDQPPLGENQDALIAYNNATTIIDDGNLLHKLLKEFEKLRA